MTAAPKACLMGHPVAHSRSPMIHGYWLKSLGIAGAYELADVTEAEFPSFLRGLPERGYVGGNITVPHKEAAFRHVDRREAAADAIGAVNTVWFEGGILFGANTDAHGFITHLDASVPDWDRTARRALIVGAGGGARAIVHALLGRGIAVVLANRTRARAEEVAAHFANRVAVHDLSDLPRLLGGTDLLINATSLGMAGKPPLDIDLGPLKPGAIVYDIVYAPLETALLRAAKAKGHRTVDGLGMLLQQAVPAFARWFGVTPKVTPQLRALVEADIRAKSGAR
jgi:shikimate dehydrogenase